MESTVKNVKWCGKLYSHYKNKDGMDVLESVDKDGFKTKLVFRNLVDSEVVKDNIVDLMIGQR